MREMVMGKEEIEKRGDEGRKESKEEGGKATVMMIITIVTRIMIITIK